MMVWCQIFISFLWLRGSSSQDNAFYEGDIAIPSGNHSKYGVIFGPLNIENMDSTRTEMEFVTFEQLEKIKKCRSNFQIETDVRFRIQRDDSESQSLIWYWRPDINAVQNFNFKGGYADHTRIEFDGQALTCVGPSNKRNYQCKSLEEGVATKAVILSIDFNPRQGKAHNNEWSRNKYSLAGNFYNVNCLASPVGVGQAWLTAKDKLWPDGIIFYQIDTSSIPNQEVHQNISLAISHIRDSSCLVFNQIMNSQEPVGDYLRFGAHGDATHDGSGCWSYMGRKGGPQVINIPAPHCTSVEVIIHEILHATGALHEHNRPDRDSYIKVLYDNILQNMRSNFMKHQWEYDNETHGVENFGTAYDLHSILHYPSYAHGINSSMPTILSLHSNNTEFGSKGLMTATDRVELNLNYGCSIDSHLIIDYLHEVTGGNNLKNGIIQNIRDQTEALKNNTYMINHLYEKQANLDLKIELLEKNGILNNFSLGSVIQNLQNLSNQFEQSEYQQKSFAVTINEVSQKVYHLETKGNIANVLDNLKAEKTGCTNGAMISNLTIKGIPVLVQCEDASDLNGVWTVIQRRGQYGNKNTYFDKPWQDYETGFGSIDGEHWFGLKNMAELTAEGEWQLQIDLTDWDGKKYFAIYDRFRVGPGPRYGLGISGYDDIHSTLGDSLAIHNSMAFTTKDKDQDIYGQNCAVNYRGGWWYEKCHDSSLNSLNYPSQKSDTKGITWLRGKSRGDTRNTWQSSVMKIRKAKSKGCINGIVTTNMEIEGRWVPVRCEDGTDLNGSWTVIQRRGQYGNPENYFDKTWKDYTGGFGSVHKELWLGLENIADITKEGKWQLQVDLTDWDGKKYFASYKSFTVGPGPRFGLGVSDFDNMKSTLGDSLGVKNAMAFSTKDKDQDSHSSVNCAMNYGGGWWYEKCHACSLNSLNFNRQVDDTKGITWHDGKLRGKNRKTWQASVMKISKIKQKSCKDGLKTVNMAIANRFVPVRCENAQDAKGAWTIIQRRGQFGNAQEYFDKKWTKYVSGFGSIHKEFWLGLENMAGLTEEGEWQLQVDLTDWNGITYFALYNSFTVGPGPLYGLGVSGFDSVNSTLGDSLARHNSMAFTTKDKDQDLSGQNCAMNHRGGWWYEKCHDSSLNSLNYPSQKSDTKGITWLHGKSRGDTRNTWQASVMKIRKIDI